MSRAFDAANLWNDLTGVVLDYALSVPPNDNWRMCFGQALSADDEKASRLRAKLIADGYPYGVDGGGNPLLPDARGRAVAGKDNMGGTAANRLTASGAGFNGSQLGAAGGSQTHTLTTAQMPAHNHGVTDPGHNHGVTDPTHAHAVNDPGHTHYVNDPGHRHSFSSGTSSTGSNTRLSGSGTDLNGGLSHTGISLSPAATSIGIHGAGTGISIQSKATGISIQNSGSGNAHQNTQPTLVLNKIIRL